MTSVATRNPVIEAKRAEIKAEAEKVKAAFDREDAGRVTDPAFAMSASELSIVTEGNRKIEALEHEVEGLEQREGLRSKNSERLAALARPQGIAQPGSGREPTKEEIDRVVRSLGQAFVEGDEYKSFLASVSIDGRIPERGRVGDSAPMRFGSMLQLIRGGNMMAAVSPITGASATSAGAFIIPDRQPDFMRLPFAPIGILDIIGHRTTQSDSVDWVRQTARANNAAPVSEATATATTGGKPQSGFDLVVDTATVQSIAHWIAATKRGLADAGQLRGMIDDELIKGLKDVVADQVMNGSGTAPNLKGILNQSGLSAQAWDTDLLTTTRKARTVARVTGRVTPTAYVMHPTDWEAIDLLTDNENRYYFGGPSVLGNPRLWGLPVVEEEKIAAGGALTGDFQLVVLWDREQASISVSDSHADFFIRNLVAILGEQRCVLGVLRPAGIVTIDTAA